MVRDWGLADHTGTSGAPFAVSADRVELKANGSTSKRLDPGVPFRRRVTPLTASHQNGISKALQARGRRLGDVLAIEGCTGQESTIVDCLVDCGLPPGMKGRD
jgi:hypothetical protein